jgi:deoxyribodipyrimidine photo-lyase
MSRDQRVSDNWAFIHARELAESADEPVIVVFALVNEVSPWRQLDFMFKGLKKVETRLRQLNIPFTVLIGDPADTLPGFIQMHHVSHLVVDFDPLKDKQALKKRVTDRISIPVDEVDAHNIVPCWVASDKEEFAAYTFRPKIQKSLHEFLDEFPPLLRQHGEFHIHRTHWEAISIAIKADHAIRSAEWLTPGENGARAMLDQFLEYKSENYNKKRNDPNVSGTSGLSPFLHFGHISAQRIALQTLKTSDRNENMDSFLEELIIRRELSDNFCYYNPNYDNADGFRSWAKESFSRHRHDPREFTYSYEQFERSETHDSLWNAAQKQLVYRGTMPGYLRMYWAKKILEWTHSEGDALAIALRLNDTYQLDGRDPNGYTGCAWSIGGTHDRAWGERSIYGKIRYMNRNGCERKFDVESYIARINTMVRHWE